MLLTACASSNNVINDDAYYSPYDKDSQYEKVLVTSNYGYFDSNSVKSETRKNYEEYTVADSIERVVDTVYIVQEVEPETRVTVELGASFGWPYYYYGWDPYWYPYYRYNPYYWSYAGYYWGYDPYWAWGGYYYPHHHHYYHHHHHPHHGYHPGHVGSFNNSHRGAVNRGDGNVSNGGGRSTLLQVQVVKPARARNT